MQDEQHRAMDERAGDPASFVADDAVTNRSDDTALDEARANGRGAPGPAARGASDQMAQDERTGEQYQAHQQSAGESGAAAEEPEADSEVAERIEQGEAAEEVEESLADEQLQEDAASADADDSRPAARPLLEEPPADEEIHMDWYILKVQSNRERSIAEALERKIRIEGLDRYFDQVIVPTEKVTEFKGGKKKVVERKLYPGYIVVHMHINDDTWFAVRETSGVGDFTGAGGKPTPMLQHEVARIIQTEEEETSEAPKLDIKFAAGDKVKVKEGNFENFEGEVNTIDEASGRVTVMINIFGRSTPVELEYWQIEAV
jgi:transcriptional antiterminator NusG